MKNFKNRVLSGALAGALAVTMAVPAFATSTVIEGTYEEPTIAVTLPDTGEALINPYGMPVELNPSATTPSSIVGAQIVTKPLAIVNNSAVDLKVSATVTATAKGDLRLATSKPSSSDTTKSAYVYLQMTNSTLDANNASTGADAIAGMGLDDVAAAVAAWEQKAYTSATDLLLSGTAAATKNDMLVLKASDTTTGSTPAAEVGSVGLFRLAGQVVASPRDAWAEADGFTATVAFSFRPDFTSASTDKPTLSLSKAGTPKSDVLTVSLDGATITKVDWESGDASKATVAADADDITKATVTAVDVTTAGTPAVIKAIITASNGLTYTVTCDVTVGA